MRLASALAAVAFAGGGAAAAEPETYAVRFDGAPDGLAAPLAGVSSLALARRAFPTAAAIRRAGAADAVAVAEALKAYGHYAARVAFRLEDSTASAGKPLAIFEIDAGPRFRIVEHVIEYADPGDATRPVDFAAASLSPGPASDGASLADNEGKLIAALLAAGYPRARAVSRRAEARLDEGTARAVYVVETGPRARFAGVEVEGATRTDPAYIARLRTFEDGEDFARAPLIAYRERLAATGLFSTIDVGPGEIAENGDAPVRIVVEERKRRTVGVGLSYSTVEGPGGRAFVENRNVFRRGESLRADISASEIRQDAAFSAGKPLPQFDGSAYARFRFARETTDAFNARSLELAGGLAKRWFDDRLETRAGVALETSKIEPSLTRTASVREERIYYVSTPISATWDTEDDPLALARGARLSLAVTPYAGSDSFTRLEWAARSRARFGPEDRFTLAGRMRAAATFGSPLEDLPVNKRVYAGGGSSVRGYDFQAVGPLDPAGVPIGGRSALEGALEARARVTGSIELAAFADAGGVFSQTLPDFGGDFLIGAGAGVRYLSPIGPIRFDVAAPLERRPTDRSWQLYISIGQPF